MRITLISDTHNKHKQLSLPGGDLLIHAGDISSVGYEHEINNFYKWMEKQDYDHLVFVPGNHDTFFEDYPDKSQQVINTYDLVNTLIDDLLMIGNEYDIQEMTKIWGTPWQPAFMNWAFNLPRGGKELEEKFNLIPVDTDILVSHGPPQGILDISGHPYNQPNLGCEILAKRIEVVRPKIHVFGHIHGSNGYLFKNGTHFFNASVLNERYEYRYTPVTFDWNKEENIIKFLE